MDRLCSYLAEAAPQLERPGAWPAEQLAVCGQAGVYRWFLEPDAGGYGWDPVQQTRGYLRLAAADLTTTFVITQRMGACRRIAGSENREVADQWLPALLDGDAFATVGISHLTTSRRHLDRPVLAARHDGDGFRLDGYSPWVTGGAHADLLVVGATLDDGREVLAAVPANPPAVTAGRGVELMALTASCTDRVDFRSAPVPAAAVLGGPVENVMSQGSGAGTGGLQTSTLAIGLAGAAVQFLQSEAQRRGDLRQPADHLAAETEQAVTELLRAADGDPQCNLSDLRGRANRLALRTTQAALTAAKGAGYVTGHPAGRWCREALFFLVWSCPQPVTQAHLCELAGIA